MKLWKSLSPSVSQKARGMALGAGAVLVTGVMGVLLSQKTEKKEAAVSQKPPETHRIDSPGQSVSAQEAWVARVEKGTDELATLTTSVQAENALLKQRIELLEEVLKKSMLSSGAAGGIAERTMDSPAKGPGAPAETSSSVEENPFQAVGLGAKAGSKEFAKKAEETTPPQNSPLPAVNAAGEGTSEKFVHLTLGEVDPLATPENFVPENAYCRTELLSALTVSTADSAASNPKPALLRVVDDFQLPGGRKLNLKNALVSASCYGDLSSERAVCRLKSLTWVDDKNRYVRRKIEGWIFGPDGREGLRGQVVDRSGQLVRDAFLAGLGSGLADFFRAEAVRTPAQGLLGTPSPLSNLDMMKGAASQGANQGLDQLVKFYIKRAESLSPVIVVNGGQTVDIVLKEGFSLEEEGAVDYKPASLDEGSSPKGGE
jgi:conjugal transfer pilus assembly protein TraB